jgi:hypothetical protein
VTPSPYRTATAEQQAADHRDACKASIVFLLIMALMFTCGYVVGAQWGAHDEPYHGYPVDAQECLHSPEYSSKYVCDSSEPARPSRLRKLLNG